MFQEYLSQHQNDIKYAHEWGVKLGWLLGQDEVKGFCKKNPVIWNSLGALHVADRIKVLRAQLPAEKQVNFDDFSQKVNRISGISQE